MIHDFPPDDSPNPIIETQEQLAAYLWRNNNISTLQLEYYQDTHLPRLPESLKELVLTDCQNLKELPPIPRTIHTMKVTRCPALSSLPSMPAELKALILSELNSLKELRPPSGLLQLHVERCERLSLIDNFGNALIKLWISKCPQFRSLPPLFDNLIDITLLDCPMITELPALPLDLRSLRLHGCTKLHARFKLSPYVVFVHITSCPFVTRK